MGKLSKTLGLSGSLDMGDDESPVSEVSEPKSPDAGLMAMKMFMRAETAEKKLSAFKALMEACEGGGYADSGDDF